MTSKIALVSPLRLKNGNGCGKWERLRERLRRKNPVSGFGNHPAFPNFVSTKPAANDRQR